MTFVIDENGVKILYFVGGAVALYVANKIVDKYSDKLIAGVTFVLDKLEKYEEESPTIFDGEDDVKQFMIDAEDMLADKKISLFELRRQFKDSQKIAEHIAPIIAAYLASKKKA
jgi:hypothetical protein